MHFLDEVLEHSFHHVEVSNHTVFERANGDDVSGGLADHGLSLGAHGVGLAAIALVHSDYRGFGHDDALPPYMNKRVGRAQVNAQVTTKKAEQSVQWAYH